MVDDYLDKLAKMTDAELDELLAARGVTPDQYAAIIAADDARVARITRVSLEQARAVRESQTNGRDRVAVFAALDDTLE